jgi:hypothetical protein
LEEQFNTKIHSSSSQSQNSEFAFDEQVTQRKETDYVSHVSIQSKYRIEYVQVSTF